MFDFLFLLAHLPFQAAFSELAKEGILLDEYYGVTHPSQPNYLATIGGDFWGLADDNEYHIPPKRVRVTISIVIRVPTFPQYFHHR